MPADLPSFLRKAHYIPDLIVRSKNENFVVEVKSTFAVRSSPQLSKISEIVNSQPKWQFILVLANPRESRTVVSQKASFNLPLALERSKKLARSLDSDLNDAALVYAWAAFELALVRLLEEDKQGSLRLGSSMLRDAAIEGHISRTDQSKLEAIYRKRNQSLHGDVPPKVRKSEIRWLNQLAETLASQLLAEHSPRKRDA
jgi:hypothetical protein